jgi:2-oxo-4-hydroxy-4-carboxy-5-ureidoimidazoline decarboxylase
MERWQRINAAAEGAARELLGECCGAPRWIERMCARRPFATRAEALAAAREEWFLLSEEEWREAFAHHPRIGDIEALSQKFASTRTLSQREQSAVGAASTDVLAALVQANRVYEERFGYIFIVCATGKSAEEMLAILNARLGNRSEDEIRVAAEEHAKICELRLGGQTVI